MIEIPVIALAFMVDFSFPLVAFRKIFDRRLLLMKVLSAKSGGLQLYGLIYLSPILFFIQYVFN